MLRRMIELDQVFAFRRLFILPATLLVAFGLVTRPVSAQNVSDCNGALVRDQTEAVTNTKYAAMGAYALSESDWNQASHDFGASATLYGIPIGASYKDFVDQRNQRYESYSYDYSGSNSTDVIAVVLGETAKDAYETCLSGLFGGLSLRIANINSDFVTVRLNFTADEKDTTPRKFSAWTQDGTKDAKGADTLTPVNKKFFARRITGPLHNVDMVINHTPHKAMVLTVSVDNHQTVLPIPLLPHIYKTDWSSPTSKSRHLYFDALYAGRDTGNNDWCIAPDTGFSAIQGTASVDQVRPTASPDCSPPSGRIVAKGFSETGGQCYYLAIVPKNAGCAAALDGVVTILQHQQVRTDISPDHDWVSP